MVLWPQLREKKQPKLLQEAKVYDQVKSRYQLNSSNSYSPKHKPKQEISFEHRWRFYVEKLVARYCAKLTLSINNNSKCTKQMEDMTISVSLLFYSLSMHIDQFRYKQLSKKKNHFEIFLFADLKWNDFL